MYVYILRCRDGSLYTGIAADMERRIKQHIGLLKNGAKYTKSHPVSYIEAIWKDESGKLARKTECAVKRLSRSEKEELIKNPDTIGEGLDFVDPRELNERFGFDNIG